MTQNHPSGSASSDPQSAPPVIPYATPEHLRLDAGAWREGNRLVISLDFKKIPPFCFKCGKPTSRYPSILVYFYRTFMPTKSASIRLPLCARHYWPIKGATVLGGMLFVSALLILFMAFLTTASYPAQVLFRWGLYLFISALFLLYFGQFRLKAANIHGRYLTLKGASRKFLEKLPEIQS